MSTAPTHPTCYYCGNNPTSHTAAWVADRFRVITKPIDWVASSTLGRFIEQKASVVAAPLVRLLATLGIVTFNTDIERVTSDRSRVIWEDAVRRGIPIRQLVVFGKSLDVYEARVGGKTVLFESLPVPAHLLTSAGRWMDDKLVLKEKLHAAGIPVPRGGAFTDFEPMVALFREIDKPVIVKPAVGSRGRHTTTCIYTEDELRQAFDVGKQIAHRLVMEQHLTGSVYRGTIIGDRLVGVLRGDPPRVAGDGVSTLAELIVKKNATRHPEVAEFNVSQFIEAFLARNGYTLDTVLREGKTIDLREKIGTSYGGYRAEEFHICHPRTKEILEAAGRVVDFPTMGFDFIIQDITKDPAGQKWGIIECNSLPFVDLHHHPLEGPSINAAKYVWDLWD